MILEMGEKFTLTRNWKMFPDRPPKWVHFIFPPPKASKNYKHTSYQCGCDSQNILHFSNFGSRAASVTGGPIPFPWSSSVHLWVESQTVCAYVFMSRHPSRTGPASKFFPHIYHNFSIQLLLKWQVHIDDILNFLSSFMYKTFRLILWATLEILRIKGHFPFFIG